MHAFKINTNSINENISSPFLPHPLIYVPKKTNSVYLMNDDYTLVPMITSAVKLRWTTWNYVLRTSQKLCGEKFTLASPDTGPLPECFEEL